MADLGPLVRQLQGAGPYNASFSLVAATSGTLAVAHGLPSVPSMIVGSVTGATATSAVSWGWSADATNVTIAARNNHPTNTAVFTVRFRIVG